MKEIAYSKEAVRSLKRMPANVARTIVLKINQYAAVPKAPANNPKPLEGGAFKGCFRFRVGDWRVVMSDNGVVVAVVEIAPRGEVYTWEPDMDIQYIDTAAGRLIVLPEAEFNRLIEAAEDASDKAAILAFRERLAAGEEEMLPAAMVERMLAGESPVRVWREHRGLSLRALAEKGGPSAAYISQIETGKRKGSLDTMRRIADLLGISLDDLV